MRKYWGQYLMWNGLTRGELEAAMRRRHNRWLGKRMLLLLAIYVGSIPIDVFLMLADWPPIGRYVTPPILVVGTYFLFRMWKKKAIASMDELTGGTI